MPFGTHSLIWWQRGSAGPLVLQNVLKVIPDGHLSPIRVKLTCNESLCKRSSISRGLDSIHKTYFSTTPGKGEQSSNRRNRYHQTKRGLFAGAVKYVQGYGSSFVLTSSESEYEYEYEDSSEL